MFHKQIHEDLRIVAGVELFYTKSTIYRAVLLLLLLLLFVFVCLFFYLFCFYEGTQLCDFVFILDETDHFFLQCES